MSDEKPGFNSIKSTNVRWRSKGFWIACKIEWKTTHLTRLFTMTPTAWGVTLKMRPVLPWYALNGIPFCMAPLPYKPGETKSTFNAGDIQIIQARARKVDKKKKKLFRTIIYFTEIFNFARIEFVTRLKSGDTCQLLLSVFDLMTCSEFAFISYYFLGFGFYLASVARM